MDEDQAALLAEAEQIVQETLELEQLAELVRMHASVAKVLDRLEAMIKELVPGCEEWQ